MISLEKYQERLAKGAFDKEPILRSEFFVEARTTMGAYGLQTKQHKMRRDFRDVKPIAVFAHYDKDGETPMDVSELIVYTITEVK